MNVWEWRVQSMRIPTHLNVVISQTCNSEEEEIYVGPTN